MLTPNDLLRSENARAAFGFAGWPPGNVKPLPHSFRSGAPTTSGSGFLSFLDAFAPYLRLASENKDQLEGPSASSEFSGGDDATGEVKGTVSPDPDRAMQKGRNSANPMLSLSPGLGTNECTDHYVSCVTQPYRHFAPGKRCDNCHGFCVSYGYWPFEWCAP